MPPLRAAAALLLISGATLCATGQAAALATGQFARWERAEAERFDQSLEAGRPTPNGLSVGFAGAICCCGLGPLLAPPLLAWYLACGLCFPEPEPVGRRRRRLVRAGWVVNCSFGALVAAAIGPLGDARKGLAWQWPGFFLLSCGSCLLTAGCVLAAFRRPAA